MELPVKAAPNRNVLLPAQFADILAQNIIGLGEIFFCKMGDRELQDFRFEQGANGKQFSDITGRKSRDNRAAVGHDGDQSLGIQLAESLSDGNSTDLVLGRDRVLAELSALGDLAANDLIAQLVSDGRRKGLPKDS